MRIRLSHLFLIVCLIAVMIMLPRNLSVTLTIVNESQNQIVSGTVNVNGEVRALKEIKTGNVWYTQLTPFKEGMVWVTVQDSLGNESSDSYFLSSLSSGNKVRFIFDGKLRAIVE